MALENPITRAVQERRSIRKYLPNPVPDDLIEALLKAAVFSPSAMNKEPWRFILVKDKKKISELSAAVQSTLTHGLVSTTRIDPIFYDAPLLILTVAPKGYIWGHIDCGIAAQSMFLVAHSLGLGSCFIGFAQQLNQKPELLKSIGVPDGYELVAPLTFGFPNETRPTPERTFQDKVLRRID